MPCRFGGTRPYFICPGVVNGIICGRRVTKLYGATRYFLCRHCYRLAYASQREDRYDRALRRANDIRIRIGGDPGTESLLPRRPKGMHERTYQHLRSKILSAEMLAEERLTIFTSCRIAVGGQRRIPRADRSTGRRAQAVEALRVQLEHERARADRGERVIEEERRRVDWLYSALADAVAAERIAAGEATALRAELDRRRDWRRPWWRRWFR